MTNSKNQTNDHACQNIAQAIEEWSHCEIPDELRNLLLLFGGLEDFEGYILSIPLDHPCSQFVSTACGTVGNRLLISDIKEFLLCKGVDRILGAVFKPDLSETHMQTIPLCSVAITISAKDARYFERLVDRHGCSLRYDSHYGPWALFESE